MADLDPSFDGAVSISADAAAPTSLLSVYHLFDRMLVSEGVSESVRWRHKWVVAFLLRAMRTRFGCDDLYGLDEDTVRLAWALHDAGTFDLSELAFFTTARFFICWFQQHALLTASPSPP